MDSVYFIRSLIFLVAGLLRFFPESGWKFRMCLIKIFRIKYNFNKEIKR